MPCYFPIQGYPVTVANANGKKPLQFSRPHGYKGEAVEIPCGRCIGCRLERSRQWALRCMHEAQCYEDNMFITLTYSPENTPEHGTLVLKDFQDFMKRYRKRFSGTTIRFFMCGEYGENLEHSKNGKLGHPHYHACIFNHSFPDRKLFKARDNIRLYTSDILSKLWPYGFSTIGDVTFESAAYTARYVLKKQLGKSAKDFYTVVNKETGEYAELKPEFTTMSRRPGIGKTWYDLYKGDLKKDFITARGVKMKPPTYYDKQLEIEDPETYEKLKEERKQNAIENEQPEKYARLRDAHKIKLKKIKQLPRNLDNAS
ncbi:MAG: replication initiator protein [Microviridae sp.]|nr:MAG: replication initiator protein [Microviridae sp.]